MAEHESDREDQELENQDEPEENPDFIDLDDPMEEQNDMPPPPTSAPEEDDFPLEGPYSMIESPASIFQVFKGKNQKMSSRLVREELKAIEDNLREMTNECRRSRRRVRRALRMVGVEQRQFSTTVEARPAGGPAM